MPSKKKFNLAMALSPSPLNNALELPKEQTSDEVL